MVSHGPKAVSMRAGAPQKRLEAEGLIEAGLTPHGLRHTLGTRLREAGADDRTIADILGQKSVSMARHYSENAALPAHARALVRSLNHTETMLYPHRHAQGGQNGLANLPMSGGDLPERQNARPPSAGR